MTTKVDFNEYTLGLSGGTPPKVESWKVTIFHSACNNNWWSINLEFPELDKNPTAVAMIFSAIFEHHKKCKGETQSEDFYGEIPAPEIKEKATFLVIPTN